MKKTILFNGIIAGLIVTAMMIGSTMWLYNSDSFEPSMVIGYLGMFIAFSFVFVGIRRFRDQQNDGIITFAQAVKIGLLISLIASTFYVVVWLIEYYVFIPDFMTRYSEFAIKQYQEEGLAGPELQEKIQFIEHQKELYKNPLYVILFTYAEILPVGIIFSVASALILKRSRKTELA